MRRTSFADMTCSTAQALEIVGDWWTPLIVRDLLLGVTRFDELQERLGIARNVLADRLGRLNAAGIVEKVRYQQHPERFDYELTAKGADLWQVINALRQWGDRWAAPDGPAVELVHRGCGQLTELVPSCSACGATVERRDLEPIDGPGAVNGPVLPRRAGAHAQATGSR